MAWQLNEVFTDSGSIPAILSYLAESPGSIQATSAGQPSAFQGALEALHINVDHIDDDDVQVIIYVINVAVMSKFFSIAGNVQILIFSTTAKILLQQYLLQYF